MVSEEDHTSMPTPTVHVPGRCERKVVIDTNVILFDAMAINKFHNSDAFILDVQGILAILWSG